MPESSVELVFLGSGNAFAYGRDWSNFVLDGKVMFEAAPTALPRLREFGMSPGDIDIIFISHLHADHIFGMPFIMLDHYYVTERVGPLKVVGPEGVEELVNQLMDLGYSKIKEVRGDRLDIEFHEVEPGREYTVGGLPFETYEMVHGKILDIGFKLNYKGKMIAYSGDTEMCDGLERMVADANLAVVEMSSPGEKIPGHMTPDDILELRKMMKKDSRLIVTHLPPLDWDIKDKLLKSTEGIIDIAEDMQRFQFDL
jgi:ribonuclease BN (tRNA processing enzyme)